MVANLEMRGCPLKGLPATPSLEAHCRCDGHLEATAKLVGFHSMP